MAGSGATSSSRSTAAPKCASWDISKESWFTKPVVKAFAAKETAKNGAQTIERIEQVVAEG